MEVLNYMRKNRLCVILSALLLAAMAVVPIASAYRADDWGPNYGYANDFSNDAYNAAVQQSNMGYGAYYDSNVPASSAWSNLPSDQVFSFNGHGNSGGIVFYDNSRIYANNPSDQKSISKLTSGQINDLALAVFVNCNSGSGGSNLLSTTVNRGGDAAVGFTGEITKFQADYWTQRFWYRLNQYSTIQDAAYYAKVDTLNTYWYLGSGGIDTVTWQGPGVSNTIKPARAGS
jgi:hypothetical protein